MSSRAPGTDTPKLCRHKGDRGECLAPDCNCPPLAAPRDPGVWHKDGPLAQVRWMAEWADRGRTGNGISPETAGKIAKNLRAAADALERRESDTRCDTAAPSDEAVEVAGTTVERYPDSMKMRRALTAAYAIDLPRVRAEERAATLREVERLLSECSRDFAGAHVNAGAVIGSIRGRLREHFNPEAE